eukprot:TRINITY_DN3096_c3_g1_i1.p1 TRINITY_DN3096_c3_g1~~TRINITY_DN3096_c3_g1_i1.p1  ORF type:complete len:744 (+),score=133.13 TRINITY_DN3096_c3_g1_i1:75-2306(+)
MFRSAVVTAGCCLATGMTFGDRLESKTNTGLKSSDLSMGDVCVRSGGKTYCELDGTLKRGSYSVTSGSDALGSYSMNTTKWSPVDFETSILTYSDGLTYIFRQRFPTGLNETNQPGHNKTSKNSISSQYPSFLIKGGPYKGYLQYQGAMLGMNYQIGSTETDISNLAGGAENSGPLALFNKDKSAVISSASNFMAHSQQLVQNSSVVGYGLMGDITFVPAGYELDTIVSYSESGSPKTAMSEWGNKLLTKYGKTRDLYEKDLTVNMLGYSTDNGAWYYYNTEEGKNYQQTIKDIKKYSESAELPYKYWLMDSWWYFKSQGGAVKNWTAMPSIFPDGIANVTASTHWPIVAHNRYWSGDTDYAKQNGGQYNFIVEDKHSIPNDQTFWDDLIGNATSWGLHTYEQDWLFNEYEDLNCTLDSPTLARDWLLQMGRGAARHGITIQYCMSWPRHCMQSIEIQQVTQARASGDYQPGHDNWQPLGVTALFGESIALRATKDNFWTTDKESSKSRYGGQKERFNRLHAAVSTFSMGPVAPSDEIGSTDVPLVMRSCRKDGTLLKPDTPAILMDSVFYTMSKQTTDGPSGSIWSTDSTVSGIKTYYLLAAESTPYKMMKSELCGDAPSGTEFVAWEGNSTQVAQKFDDSNPIALPQTDKWDFNLWTAAPILYNGWVVMGEATSKWVSMSKQRFNSVAVEKSSVTVELAGQSGEEVEVLFLEPSKSMNSISVKCTFSSDKLMITMPGSTCH